MENSKFTLYLEEVLIDEEILQILQIYDAKAKTAGINLVKEFEFKGITIEGDSSRLRQVFINLLDNAIKFTPEGKNIFINIVEKEDSLEIVLQDEGIGISSEDLKYVKDKFYKGKSKKSGSGIGLAVSDEIMKLHGGELIIESEDKKGTKATMKISKM